MAMTPSCTEDIRASEPECGTKTCEAKGVNHVFWPGREPLPMCEPCTDRAKNISAAMGFYLHVEPLNDI